MLLPFALLARVFPRLKPFFDRIFGSGAPPLNEDEGAAYSSEPRPSRPPPAPPNATIPPPPAPAPPPIPASPAKQAFDDLGTFTTPLATAVHPLPSALELQQRYDFHQMIAALGDYPRLLRMFGLVVDLRVDLNGATPAAEGRVKVEPGLGLSPTGRS
jgi:hypothetical protein